MNNYTLSTEKISTVCKSNKTFYFIVLLLAIIISLLYIIFSSRLHTNSSTSDIPQPSANASISELVGRDVFAGEVSLDVKEIEEGGDVRVVSGVYSIYGTMIFGVEEN